MAVSMKRVLIACGIIASLLYAGTVVMGGVLHPGYDPVRQTISELIARGAPFKPALDGLFIVYNILVVFFGAGMLLSAQGQGRMVLAASRLLVALGVLGVVLTVFFPLDAPNSPQTITGTMHLAFSGLLSLFTVLSLLFFGLGWRHQPGFHGLALYALASYVFIVVTGALTLAGRTYMGLIERLTIGGFLQWVLITAIVLTLRYRHYYQENHPQRA